MGSLRFSVAACLVALAALHVGRAGAAATAPREEEKKAFSLSDVMSGAFSARGLGAVWVSGNELASSSTNVGIQLHNVETNDNVTIVKSSKLQEKPLSSWVLLKNSNKLLGNYDVQAGYRHSTQAKYSVLDTEKEEWSNLHSEAHLQTALLSPNGKGVAYVFENNVYYVDDISSSEPPKQITKDGLPGTIYNGVPDWVYEEEVLSSGSALWFSPSGKYLAFGKFDDTAVEEFSYIMYYDEQYTKVETLRYPKPGTPNPIPAINVIDLTSLNNEPQPEPTAFKKTFEGDKEEPILQNVAWIRDNKFIVVWLNRIQNKISIVSYTATEDTETGETVWNENDEFSGTQDGGWYEVGTPRAADNNGNWALLMPTKLSVDDDQGYLRPVLFKANQNEPVLNIVSEKITATALYGWDTTRKLVFYQAAPAEKPGQRQVYSVSDEGGEPTCLSCDIKQPSNDKECLYASASFSQDLTHATIACSGPGPASVGLIKVNEDGTKDWVDYYQKNEELISSLSDRLLPTIVPTTVSVVEGYTAQVRLWLPPGLDEKGDKKYPMLVYVYGGPGSQQVSEAFSVSWGYHLTTEKNIIYASIDGRGSGLQGNKNLFANYKKLGTLEVEDQISVTRKLVETFSYIDKDRVGIWGWSYGGYATAMALAKDNDKVFACGASVAPVTSWDLYDTIYTERYMDLPVDNTEGYEAANISKNIENFKTHQFYLLHGNADDNVHYQQSMRLARVLEEANVFFEQQSYPDEAHSIRSVNTHVYMSLGVFFDRCFEKVEVTTCAAVHVLPVQLPAVVIPLISLLLV